LLKRICNHPLWLALTIGLAVASLVASKTNSLLGSNLAIGVAFTLFIGGLGVRNVAQGFYVKLATGIGETSYTLYVTHFPFLAFIFFVFFKGERFQPGVTSFSQYFGLFFITFAYAALVWCCFERNTDSVRKWIESKLSFLRPASGRSPKLPPPVMVESQAVKLKGDQKSEVKKVEGVD
jgi:peptidoglycan/LPS O-acetylase OafA/YrhL